MSRRKTLGLMLVACGLGVGLAFAADRAADEGRDDSMGSDRYSLDCRILLASDNDPIPPTLFGRYPTKGVQSFVAVAEVTNGRLGTTRLDGTRFAMFGKAAGDWRRGKRFEALSLYLDEDATPEQRRAMGTIFRTDELFRAEGLTSLTTTKIRIDRASYDSLARIKATIGIKGERGELTIVPMKGADGTNPVGVHNAYTFFDEKESVSLGTANVRFSDHGRELKTTGSSGEIHRVRLTGSVHGVLEEESGEGTEH